MKKDLSILEKKTGHVFRDITLLRQALMHPSWSGEMNMKRCESNQRLEFLGDAVLELVISDHLYRTHKTADEGELTRKRSSLVFEAALCVCARDLGLGEFILLGRGERMSGGSEKPSILSDTFEAIIGAVYLDGGYEAAREFITEHVINDIDEMTLLKDAKSVIQEYVQRTEGNSMSYDTYAGDVSDSEKQFCSDLYINNVLVSSGSGKSKKLAEQDAASQAAEKLGIGNRHVS